jgi:hypothetical protein
MSENSRRDILEELRICRKIISAGEELTPRLLVYSPNGNFLMMLPWENDETDRQESFHLAHLFMVWKAATGFILSIEIKGPNAIVSTRVTRDEVLGASQLIKRNPVKFSEPVWYGREEIDERIIGLLPAKTVQLSADDLKVIQDLENDVLPELTWFSSEDLE